MGAVVALDVRTGDVLALVSKPSFDPNDFAGGIDAETWKQLTTDEWRPIQNRAISGQYPPGSTYKAIVAAAGLEEGVIDSEPQACSAPATSGSAAAPIAAGRTRGTARSTCTARWSSRATCTSTRSGVELGIDRLAFFARGFDLGPRDRHPAAARAAGSGADERLEGAPLQGAVDGAARRCRRRSDRAST